MTILYALGYLVKPGTERGIVKTGLIYISTVPSGASVYIGDKRFTERTPTLLRDLLPGTYPIRMSLKNHRGWFQNVPVEAEKATVLEKILFVPSELKRKELSAEVFEKLIPLEKSNFFLLAAGSRPADFFVFDWKQEKIRPLLDKNQPFLDGKVLSLNFVPGSPRLLMMVHVRGGEKYLWMEVGEKETAVEDLSVCFQEEPVRVEWDPRERNRLFALYDTYVNRVDVSTRKVMPHFLDSVRGFGLFRGDLYALQGDLIFERLDVEGNSKEILLNDRGLGRSLFGEKGFFQINVLTKESILFRGPGGELLANRLPYRFLEEGTQGVQFHQGRERVLAWRDGAIGILDFLKLGKTEDVFEKGPVLSWVFKHGKRIEQAFWVYDGSHILFRDENRIFLLEFETHGKPHLYPLLEVKRKSDVFYAEALFPFDQITGTGGSLSVQGRSGKLYYLDAQSEKLCSVEILPKQEILPFSFPVRKEQKRKIKIEEF